MHGSYQAVETFQLAIPLICVKRSCVLGLGRKVDRRKVRKCTQMKNSLLVLRPNSNRLITINFNKRKTGFPVVVINSRTT